MDNLYAAHLETLQALYSRYRLPPRAGGKRARQMDQDGWQGLTLLHFQAQPEPFLS
jgi:hypothetical protein